MKIKFLILSAALVISASACDKKTDTTSIPATPVTEVIPKIQKPVEQVKKINDSPANPGKTMPVKTETSAKISVPVVNKTTEQSLAEISTYGREVTKTQVSKSRTRAQEAEDEMMQELAQQKK